MDKIIKDKIPVMGNIIVETIKVKREDFEKEKASVKGVSQDFLDKFTIVSDDKTFGAYAPINCGKVIKLSKDSFGKAYEHNYGDDAATQMRELVKEGTIVYFVANQGYRIDPHNRYHMINDTHVLMIENVIDTNVKNKVEVI